MSDNTQTKQERDSLKRKLYTAAICAGIVAILLIIIVPIITRPQGGLYIVNACNDRGACYTLQADVTIDEYDDGSTMAIRVNELYFNNGGSVELDCNLPDKFLGFTTDDGFCKEINGGRNWDIVLSKRLGDTKR